MPKQFASKVIVALKERQIFDEERKIVHQKTFKLKFENNLPENLVNKLKAESQKNNLSLNLLLKGIKATTYPTISNCIKRIYAIAIGSLSEQKIAAETITVKAILIAAGIIGLDDEMPDEIPMREGKKFRFKVDVDKVFYGNGVEILRNYQYLTREIAINEAIINHPSVLVNLKWLVNNCPHIKRLQVLVSCIHLNREAQEIASSRGYDLDEIIRANIELCNILERLIEIKTSYKGTEIEFRWTDDVVAFEYFGIFSEIERGINPTMFSVITQGDQPLYFQDSYCHCSINDKNIIEIGRQIKSIWDEAITFNLQKCQQFRNELEYVIH